MNSLVSIVVPLYNKEEYIQRCIDSLLSQTYEHLEILIVDDGSTDRSGEIADAVRDERLVVIHQENRGLSEARNTGINHSSGEYLVFVDADDTVPKNGVKDLVVSPLQQAYLHRSASLRAAFLSFRSHFWVPRQK